jgi:tetratricopeptide (TPR) repeat protein
MSFERGNKFLEEKKYDEAIEEYKKAINELPNPPMAHNNLGLVYS